MTQFGQERRFALLNLRRRAYCGETKLLARFERRPLWAIWQYRLTLIPESVLLTKYEILPLAIPMGLAEEFSWWSNNQPATGFEQQISLILPEAKS